MGRSFKRVMEIGRSIKARVFYQMSTITANQALSQTASIFRRTKTLKAVSVVVVTAGFKCFIFLKYETIKDIYLPGFLKPVVA